MDDEVKQLFYQNYGDLPFLLDVKVDRHLFRAMGYKAYVRPANLPTFAKKLVMITRMSEQWAIPRILQKGDSKCIPWFVLRDLILTHPDVKKKVDILALGIYGMVIFPKALGHIDEAVADLFDRLGKQNTPVPTILAETIRSLTACRSVGEGRFIGCAQLLVVWFHSHFWKLDKDLREEDIMWKAPSLVPSEVLYRCGNFDWIPLPGIWRAVGYTPLLVLRQYQARQFILATQGLAQSDFSYKGDHYKKRMQEISEAWKKPFYMKILIEGSTSTLEYKGWFSRRVNDNVPRPTLGVARSLEESLRVIPSEVEVMKQEFERKNSELEKRMEKLEEEKMCLNLDVDVQKLEVEKVRKEKRKIEEDRDDLKMHYKKAQVTLKKAGLGKSSE
ncbi:hypothetical protein CXB51_004420 [Gossypium anomalum]|uniref:DUF7745 domain-containing protein n=1 Tax=Gossypium anomalum TaxID=47600 RepID=A0A8J6D9J7_9ROSI|nr:hypothetical protein CXB51_004420 [Gossypium anomalum]